MHGGRQNLLTDQGTAWSLTIAAFGSGGPGRLGPRPGPPRSFPTSSGGPLQGWSCRVVAQYRRRSPIEPMSASSLRGSACLWQAPTLEVTAHPARPRMSALHSAPFRRQSTAPDGAQNWWGERQLGLSLRTSCKLHHRRADSGVRWSGATRDRASAARLVPPRVAQSNSSASQIRAACATHPGSAPAHPRRRLRLRYGLRLPFR